MTKKVTIERCENLPMPLIYLATARDLARWQMDQLTWAYEQGHRDLTLSFFDTTAMGFETVQAASAVMKAVMDFLNEHPDVANLTIFCGNPDPQPLISELSRYKKSGYNQLIPQ